MKIICTKKEKENFINKIISLDCEDCPIFKFCSTSKDADTCREIVEEQIDWGAEN